MSTPLIVVALLALAILAGVLLFLRSRRTTTTTATAIAPPPADDAPTQELKSPPTPGEELPKIAHTSEPFPAAPPPPDAHQGETARPPPPSIRPPIEAEPVKPFEPPRSAVTARPEAEKKASSRPALSEPKRPVAPAFEHDAPMSAKITSPSPPVDTKTTVPTTSRQAPPASPETADLERSDPRHAAARRLARLSVSEIKLYHEEEVKLGRDRRDLWTRLGADLSMAQQTFDKRVDKEVRERFDYLYDEVVRQLAEGDPSRLGPGAPQKKSPAPAPAPAPPAPMAETETPIAPAVAPAVPPAAKQTLPSAQAVRPIGPNPETADLEKSDPRHAAARRLARLSVSEIKLYHEDEVTLGRERKDLWVRLAPDISMAVQTFDKRVDKEVRERFDYLYDEILRQLAEGDASRLGDAAPKPKGGAVKVATEPPPTPQPVAAPVAKAEPATRPEPKPESAPATPKFNANEITTAAAKTTSPSAGKQIVAPPAETADLEKGDPRHAAARRFARLSVSEIKLYHEDEVKTGREKRDLWTRLAPDISMATQAYDKRVDKDVRERFDYLHDEIVRQLAEGDPGKLGDTAPRKGIAVVAAVAAVAAAPAQATAPSSKGSFGDAFGDGEAAAARAPSTPKEPAAAPQAAASQPRQAVAPAASSASTDLEKSDPRHAAARRFARLAVSEIKLYHEDEVKAGREKKDLWTRLGPDISMAIQTYEKRVDREVRERFDYLHDEILRQLAEGDPSKLGPNAPKR